MKECEQTKGQSVLQHGHSVWQYTQRILNKNLDGFRVPKWLENNYDKILQSIHDYDTIRNYNIYHDCGKPYCLIKDEEGRKHFPNHAQVSKETWNNSGGDKIVGKLIGLDMVLHTETAEEIKQRNLDLKDAMTLLITALAEVHSNASMFGGVESNSFKSKWRKIERRGNMLMKEYF